MRPANDCHDRGRCDDPVFNVKGAKAEAYLFDDLSPMHHDAGIATVIADY